MSVSLLALAESAGGDGYIHSTFLNVSGQIIIPADVDVILIAIGGGGGSRLSAPERGAAGGGGFTFKKHKFSSKTTLTGTVGAGGSTTPTDGGATQIVGTGINMIANGGAKAAEQPANAAGGTASGGDINLTGAAGLGTATAGFGNGGPRFAEHYPTIGYSNYNWLNGTYRWAISSATDTARYSHAPYGLFITSQSPFTAGASLEDTGTGGPAASPDAPGVPGIIIAFWKHPQ